MPERLRSLVTAGVIALMTLTLVVLVVSSPSHADRVESLGSRIKCPVCEGQPIADSPSQMARDMMALVDERVAQGASDQEIVEELLSSYSGALLLDPPARGFNLLLWLAPGAALAAGIAVIAWWRTHPPAPRPSPATLRGGGSRRRALVGGLVLAVGLGGAVVAAGFFLQEREGPLMGVIGSPDLTQVSSETMEAVIAANLSDPQINGMRLALAERYFEEGDYRSAFPHYLAVAESTEASVEEAVAALTRLGWMVWDGNREAATAVELFDQALAIDPAASTAMYLKGQVVWCGLGDSDGAARLFSEVLALDGLTERSRTAIQADLEATMQGKACA